MSTYITYVTDHWISFLMFFIVMILITIIAVSTVGSENHPPKNKHFHFRGKEDKQNEKDVIQSMKLQEYKSLLKEQEHEASKFTFESQSIDDNTEEDTGDSEE